MSKKKEVKTVTKTEYKGGAGAVTIFTALFVGLKLSGHIDWSWWWVLSPLWILVALILAVILIFLLFIACVGVYGYCKK